MANRTPWDSLSQASQQKARLAGVTVLGYRAGAWVPWQRGVKRPSTKYAKAKQRSVNRFGLTPDQLKGFSPNTKKVLGEMIGTGFDPLWLSSIPWQIRPQAFRYYKEMGRKPPQREIDAFRRVPSWKKPILNAEINVYFAKRQNPSRSLGPNVPASLYNDTNLLADDEYRRRQYFFLKQKNIEDMQIGDVPEWYFWYH